MRRASLLIAGGLLCLAAISPARGADPWDEDIAPEGVWLHEWDFQSITQDKAWDRNGKLRGLKSYLLSTSTLRNATTGSVTRKLERADLRLTYGFSDTWNLAASMAYLRLRQDSNMATARTVGDSQAEVASFDDQELTGAGSLRLWSLWRPVFSDKNGFVWGLGLRHPVQSRDARPGPRAMALRDPNAAVLALIHYTRYPHLPGGRFDLRIDADIGLEGSELERLDGGKESYREGNQAQVHLGWAQDVGPLSWGIALRERRQAQSRLGGVGQLDLQLERGTLLRLGFGNLPDLERGPVAFPYEFVIEWARTHEGFNIINRNDFTLTFRYFL